MGGQANDLIDRLIQGDASSFDDVIKWYANDIIRMSYLLLWNEEDAKDVLQETMIRFVQQIRRGKIRSANGSIKHFLLVVARNLSIDRLRKQKRLEHKSQPFDEQVTTVFEMRSPDKVLDDSLIMEAFEKQLDRLSDSQRAAIVLFELEGESIESIAKSLGASTSKIKTDIHRARKKMRPFLETYLKAINNQ